MYYRICFTKKILTSDIVAYLGNMQFRGGCSLGWSERNFFEIEKSFLLCSAGKLHRGVYSQIYFDVSPGNGRQASENRTQGGKPTLSESERQNIPYYAVSKKV